MTSDLEMVASYDYRLVMLSIVISLLRARHGDEMACVLTEKGRQLRL